MNKCYNCLFAGEYRDMGASTPVCNRCAGLCEAVKEYEKAEPCQWYITKAEVIRLQNEGVIEPKPFIPPEKPTSEAMQSIGDISRLAAEVVEKMADAIRKAVKFIENGGKPD